MTDRSAAEGKVEILPPNKRRQTESETALAFPDLAPDMSIGLALSERLRYWGYRRTLDTYRATVASGLALTQSLNTLYSAKRELEEERERWANIDIYRKGASKEAGAFLREVEARYLAAEKNEIEGQISLQQAKDRLAALEVLQMIDENDRAAEKARSEVRRLEAERKLDDLRGGGGGSSYRDRRRKLEKLRQDYEALMADKRADIEKYGGADKLPHWLQTFYDKLEDELGMDER